MNAIRFCILIISGWLALSCSSVLAAKNKPPTAKTAAEMQVLTENGKPALNLRSSGDHVEIQFINGSKTNKVTGKMHGDTKRKYDFNSTGFEVKSDESGFKLRTLQGKLLWKVKLAQNKIKISNNEEGTNACQLLRQGDDIKVECSTKAIGSAHFDSSSKTFLVTNNGQKRVFSGRLNQLSSAPGVLLLKEIPERERDVLMVEILARDR